VPWDRCERQDLGDGILLLVPPDVPKAFLVEVMCDALASALRVHNATHSEPEQLRVRMAVHAGEVTQDEHGLAGTAVNHAFRLIDAPQSRAALARSAGCLVVIASAWFYDEVIRHCARTEPNTYVPTRVQVKETDTIAWIASPGARNQDAPCRELMAAPVATATAPWTPGASLAAAPDV
jgi:hypothetical protein